METVIVGLIVAGAGVWLFFKFRGTAKGKGGCSCGSCGAPCAERDK